jgi:FkbM family methyltransferase
MDVGMLDGADTAYYLSSGYRVVGVDANPLVIENCTARFEREIAEGLLTLLNVGISDQEQTLTFYHNLSEPGQSSFFPEYGQRGGKFVSMEVPCTTLRQIIESHGIPYYLKVDIEGMDETAILSLDATTRPRYVSAELNRSGRILEHLQSIGYTHFKLLNGIFHTASLPIFQNEIGWRLLRKSARKIPPLQSAIRRLPRKFRPKIEWDSHFSINGATFDSKMAGPFGEKSDGRWMTQSETRDLLNRIADLEALPDGSLWWNLHAKMSE